MIPVVTANSVCKRRQQIRSAQAGFTFLILLLVVAVMLWALASVATVWGTVIKREKERDLLFVGQQFRQALESYNKRSPQGTPRFPEKLEDLLLDNRMPGVQRHLRRLYRDPLTNREEWGLVRQGGRIVGVYSLAEGEPLLKSGFTPALAQFADASNYADWKFVAESATAAPGNAPIPAPGAAQPVIAAAVPPKPLEERQSIPSPAAPCTVGYDRAVESCWSIRSTDAENFKCEAEAQVVYNECMRAHVSQQLTK